MTIHSVLMDSSMRRGPSNMSEEDATSLQIFDIFSTAQYYMYDNVSIAPFSNTSNISLEDDGPLKPEHMFKLVYMPILLVLGTTGNMLSGIIMLRTSLR